MPDVAALLGETTFSSLGMVVLNASLPAGAALYHFAPPEPAKCVYSSATGYFVCPQFAYGFTYTPMFRLSDAAGNSQPKADAQTVSIEVKTTFTGEVTSTTTSTSLYEIEGASDYTLTGLRTDKHTLNGSATANVTGWIERNGQRAADNETVSETVTNLVLPSTRAGQEWPQSGTIAVDIRSNPNNPVLPELLHMQLLFDGTHMVALAVTDSFGTKTCKVDLTNASGFQACR